MAFVDLTNFKDWPMGGMLEYELAILPYLAEYYDLDIWGYSLNGVIPMPLVLNGKEYPVHVCGNCSTNRRIIPNFWRGLSIFKHKSYFLNRYDIVYAHTNYYLNAGKGKQGTASGGLRGKFWFERMKADHLDDIIKTAKEKSGGK